MVVEQTAKEIVIKVPIKRVKKVQKKALTVARYKKIITKSKATQEDIDNIVKEIKSKRKKRQLQ